MNRISLFIISIVFVSGFAQSGFAAAEGGERSAPDNTGSFFPQKRQAAGGGDGPQFDPANRLSAEKLIEERVGQALEGLEAAVQESLLWLGLNDVAGLQIDFLVATKIDSILRAHLGPTRENIKLCLTGFVLQANESATRENGFSELSRSLDFISFLPPKLISELAKLTVEKIGPALATIELFGLDERTKYSGNSSVRSAYLKKLFGVFKLLPREEFSAFFALLTTNGLLPDGEFYATFFSQVFWEAANIPTMAQRVEILDLVRRSEILIGLSPRNYGAAIKTIRLAPSDQREHRLARAIVTENYAKRSHDFIGRFILMMETPLDVEIPPMHLAPGMPIGANPGVAAFGINIHAQGRDERTAHAIQLLLTHQRTLLPTAEVIQASYQDFLAGLDTLAATDPVKHGRAQRVLGLAPAVGEQNFGALVRCQSIIEG